MLHGQEVLRDVDPLPSGQRLFRTPYQSGDKFFSRPNHIFASLGPLVRCEFSTLLKLKAVWITNYVARMANFF